MNRTCSISFDGHQYGYQFGERRMALLDDSQLSSLVSAALQRRITSLGKTPGDMAERLVLLMMLASKQCVQGGQILFLGGNANVLWNMTGLLRAAMQQFRVAVLAENLPPTIARVPEVFALSSDIHALAAPARGYDVCMLFDDGTLDAAGYAYALKSLRPGGQAFCVTGRQSMLSAAQAVLRGRLYPVTDHIVCFAGTMSAKSSKKFPPLPPAPLRTLVFLPYKAAMWDCLESIWRAAAADPSTRAYVVPIPFAEKNPDGTVRDWQYEGGRLPEGVPVVDWREIDLAALHPDAVFIHNPFDDCNNVTTVDARYYTTELKKITRKLIYVPYYATGGWIYPELVTPPGYQTADHVIVENDADRAKFEQFYPAPPVPPGKFWALGSPKFDKVRTDRREDYPLPEAWAQLLAGKKAVLYNTTLVAALQNTVHFLPKLQWVLEQFRAAGDIMLWWRPHPLLLPTLHSMRPELAAVYEQLVADYRAQGWFIYDDTPDLHRAIAWTDAYYGDYGSMIWLMQAAGKPALAQNYGIHDGF